MKNRKRLLFLAIVLFTVSLPLSASGDSEENSENKAAVNLTGWPIVDEKITLEMMGNRATNQADWNTMRIWEWYEEKTNIHVNWTTVDSEAIKERFPLIMASGDYGEALYGMAIKSTDEIKYGSQGILIPLEDLIDLYAPNIKAFLDSDPAIRKTYTAPDGHIYTFPAGTDRTVFLNAYHTINVHWLDVLGLDMPESIDDLYNVMKAFKTGDPNGNGKADEIPMCLDLKGSFTSIWYLLQWFGITSDKTMRVYAGDDGKVIYVPTDDRMLAALKWLNKCWNDGLIDQEAFTHTWREIDAKGQNREAEIVGLFDRSTIAWTVGFDRFDDYEIMPALTNQFGTKMVTGRNVEAKGRFSITNKAKNPEAIIRWIDYFATIEGAMNIQMGPEGEAWSWTDDTKTTFNKGPVPQSTSESVTPKNGTLVPFINFNSITTDRYLAEGEIDWQAKVYEGIDKYLHPYRRVAFPDAYMSAEQVSIISSLQADLNTYVDQMIARFIVGDEPFDHWDTYVETVNKMNIDQLIDVYQDVYDSYNK